MKCCLIHINDDDDDDNSTYLKLAAAASQFLTVILCVKRRLAVFDDLESSLHSWRTIRVCIFMLKVICNGFSQN